MVLAGARTAYILYERHLEEGERVRKQPPPLNPDYYVTPKKLYLYDLKSAHQLTQEPVWVKVGYAYAYYPYDPVRRSVNFAREAGQLLPLEELRITDILAASAPGNPDRQIVAVLEKTGKAYAFSIGTLSHGDYRFYSDDMLYIEDPHQLYKSWPADVWDAINEHEVKLGMSELQVSFAIGLGIPEGSGASGDKTTGYANGGKPLSVSYRDGKVAGIQPGG